MAPRTGVPSWTLVVWLTLGAGAVAGDTFVNFEDPQTKPIAVIAVGGIAELEPYQQAVIDVEPEPVVRKFLVVANTPDNSVEIDDANWPWDFITRVRTGLGPVTVRWNRALSRLYACNFSGDSVAVIHLILRTGGTLVATLERIVDVGGQPSDSEVHAVKAPR